MTDIGKHTTLNQVYALTREDTTLKLSLDAIKKIEDCYTYLTEKLKNSDDAIYGVNTGFGSLYNTIIDKQNLSKLQENLIKSHACGMGSTVSNKVVKLMLLLKVLALSKGHSGVQLVTVQRLLAMYNQNHLPEVKELGSLGASGDLAPLAHLVLPLVGIGKISTPTGWVDAKTLDYHKNYTLKAKEGLALLNGTQFMSAHGTIAVIEGLKLLETANKIAAMSTVAFDGNMSPYLPQSHAVRNQKGQQYCAAILFKLLDKSPGMHTEKEHVQDPYSFRCTPQVHGASYDVLQNAKIIFEQEVNAVTDNPTIFPEDDLILSAGNFHGQTLAMQLDFIGIALAEMANISERRIYKLISGERGLPSFLMEDSGLNSGFMIAQYTAASIVSQNKQLCTPASVDSIVSSNGQEDHVSMGANAATKCLKILKNTQRVLGIELLLTCQAADFRGIDMYSDDLKSIYNTFRNSIPFIKNDVWLSPMMEKSFEFVKGA